MQELSSVCGVQIMELLGQSLWDVCNVPARNCLSEAYVACVAIEALTILQGMHEKGWGPSSVSRQYSTLASLVQASLPWCWRCLLSCTFAPCV